MITRVLQAAYEPQTAVTEDRMQYFRVQNYWRDRQAHLQSF